MPAAKAPSALNKRPNAHPADTTPGDQATEAASQALAIADRAEPRVTRSQTRSRTVAVAAATLTALIPTHYTPAPPPVEVPDLALVPAEPKAACIVPYTLPEYADRGNVLAPGPSGITATVHNIVSTMDFKCKIDLRHICVKARNVEFNPARFPGAVMRLSDPRATAMIFASGKCVCLGTKTEAMAKFASRKVTKIMQKLGQDAHFRDFAVRNLMGTADMRAPIRLEGLCYTHGRFAQYEPEIFPALIYRMQQPKVTLMIFVNGKVILTGAKTKEQLTTAFETIYPVLKGFQQRRTDRNGDAEMRPEEEPVL